MASLSLKDGRLTNFTVDDCDVSKCRLQIRWGCIIEQDEWKLFAGSERHLTTYFSEHNLWGYLSANPEKFDPMVVVEFLNNSSITEEGSILSRVNGVEMLLSEDLFADVFNLVWEAEGGIPELESAEVLQSMLEEKKNPSINLDDWTDSLWRRPRTHFNIAYNSLAFILLRDFEGKVGGMSNMSHERFTMLYAIHTNKQVRSKVMYRLIR